VKKRRNSHFFVLLSTVSHFATLLTSLIQLFRYKSYICTVIDRQDKWCSVEYFFKMAKRPADVALSERLEILEITPHCQNAVNVLPLNNSTFLSTKCMNLKNSAADMFDRFCVTNNQWGNLLMMFSNGN